MVNCEFYKYFKKFSFPNQPVKFKYMLGNRADVFADPKQELPFNTSIVGSLRAEYEEPIYSKFYPYPMIVADFVSSETRDLLKNGIIRPSRSQ